MRAELIVLLVCVGLIAAAVVFCYICLVVASDADRGGGSGEKDEEGQGEGGREWESLIKKKL